MESLKYQDIETIALIVFALAFVGLEKLYPKHDKLNIKAHLKNDIAAFILLIVGVNFSRFVVTEFYEYIKLKDIGIIAATLS